MSMFRFENPQYLYFIAVLVVLVAVRYYTSYRRRIKIRRYGDPALVRELFEDVSRVRPELKFWLAMMALLSFIIALARPQYGTRVEKRERQGIECIIALDVSNSMLAEDVKPSRLEKAKMLVSNMVDEMTDDKVGLIVFAGQAFTQLPITSDYVSAKMFLETISPGMMSVQGTDIATAIDLATKSFTQQKDVSRAVFVITDGEDNEGGAEEAAKVAAEMGIHVYMLGVGNPSGAPIPVPGTTDYIVDEEGQTVMSRLNEEMCQQIAQKGNGAYIYVDNSSSAQNKLSQQLDKLSKSVLESQSFSAYDEQFQGFIVLGLLLLFLDMCIIARRNAPTNFIRKFIKLITG